MINKKLQVEEIRDLNQFKEIEADRHKYSEV